MSRTPSSISLPVVMGSTWEDFLDYFDEDGNPVDLTGYEARMQVRDRDHLYGTTTSESLLLELLSTGLEPKLFIETPPGGTVKNRTRIRVDVPDLEPLNPDNERKVVRGCAVELYIPGPVEYVIPLAVGTVPVMGRGVR